MGRINTIRELNALIGNLYVGAVAVIAVALIIAYFASRLINWQDGNKIDTSPKLRRTLFLSIGPIVSFLYFIWMNATYTSAVITRSTLIRRFTTNTVAIIVFIVVFYYAIGFITIKRSKNNKWSSIGGINLKKK